MHEKFKFTNIINLSLYFRRLTSSTTAISFKNACKRIIGTLSIVWHLYLRSLKSLIVKILHGISYFSRCNGLQRSDFKTLNFIKRSWLNSPLTSKITLLSTTLLKSVKKYLNKSWHASGWALSTPLSQWSHAIETMRMQNNLSKKQVWSHL